MANIYYSYIRCLIIPELTTTIDPEKIIKKSLSQSRFKRFDELVNQSR